jgi:hypothetical protein
VTSTSGNSRDDSAVSRVGTLGSAPATIEQLRTQLNAAISAIVPRMVLPQQKVVVSDEQWVAVLTPFCTGARRLRLPIELVILTCKEVWHSLPVARLIPEDESEGLMCRLVTLCIETYFAFPATTTGD